MWIDRVTDLGEGWYRRRRSGSGGRTYAVEDHQGGLGEGGVEICFAGSEKEMLAHYTHQEGANCQTGAVKVKVKVSLQTIGVGGYD